MDGLTQDPSIDSPGPRQAEITGPTFLSAEPSPFFSGTRTPPERTGTNKRKLTLLALIDELTELRDEEQEKGREREREINYGPTGDERLSSEIEGAGRFQAFDERIHKLDLKLQSFTNAVRMLGASVAAEQFDEINHEPNPDAKLNLRRRVNGQRNRSPSPDKGHTTDWRLGEIEELPAEMELLAQDLQEFLDRLNEMPDFVDESMNTAIMPFAGDLMYRASCLREFEGQLKFVAVARYINDLSEDLGEHMDRMRDSLDIFIDVGIPTIRFSEKITATSLQNLSAIATFLSSVAATTLQSVLHQFSFNNHGSPLPDLVNTLWISSLVFSIACAINSQLAYHWHSSQYRSPQNYVPRWVTIWVMRAPLFFLVASVMAYLTGLGLFTYTSGQSRVVSIMITTFTVVTAFTWFYVGLWVTSERWTNTKAKGSRWFLRGYRQGTITNVTPAKHSATIGSERAQTSADEIKQAVTHTSKHVMAEDTTSLVDVSRKLVRHSISALSTMVYFRNRLDPQDAEAQSGAAPTHIPTYTFGTGGSSRHGNLGNGGTLENHELSGPDGWAEDVVHGDQSLGVNTRAPVEVANLPSATTSLEVLGGESAIKMPVSSPEASTHEDLPLVVNTLAPSVIMSPPSAGESSRVLDESALETAVLTTEAAGPVTPRNAKFKAAAKRVMGAFKLAPPVLLTGEPVRSISSPSVFSEPRHWRDSSEHQLNPTRMQRLIPMLRTLRCTQMLGEHVAFVKHLQFSPDGQFLATCSWDKTALIWKVGSGVNDGFEVIHKLVHTSGIGGFVGQVAWSPTTGDQLLTKQLKAVKVWDAKTGVCKRTINRKRNVQSITWMPRGSGFVSIEWQMETKSPQVEKRAHYAENIVGSDLVILSADGTVRDDHYLERLQVWDAVVTPDEVRMVAVATLIRSAADLKPVKSRSEKRILIYNLATKEIENQVPFLQEVRDVTLTEQGTYALVSYENRDPPQAWRIDMIAREQKCRLVLAHTYFTKRPVDFAGPSYFGGVNDTFVLCASKGGEIYIWERASGILLHSLKAPDQELTNIAWNHKSPSGFMFASAAHDGIVRIWTTTAPPPPARSLALSPEPVDVDSPTPAQQEFFRPGSPPMASPGLFSPGST